MGHCPKCGSGTIQRQVGSDMVDLCIVCPGKKQGVAKPGYKPPVDPGEEAMKALMKGQAVKATAQPTGTTVIAEAPTRVSGTVESALNIMKSLPMPDDIKQFKQIKKIISQIEKLIEVQKNDSKTV